jgi:hypothetical protein
LQLYAKLLRKYVLAILYRADVSAMAPADSEGEVLRLLWELSDAKVDEQPGVDLGEDTRLEGPSVLARPARSPCDGRLLPGNFCQSTRSGYEAEFTASVVLAFEDGRTVRADIWPDPYLGGAPLLKLWHAKHPSTRPEPLVWSEGGS